MANSRLLFFPWAAPLAWLWFVLINDLRVEWTVNPQYSYGWAVPFLCVYLLWQRVRKMASGQGRTDLRPPIFGVWFSMAIFCLLAFLYAPTRLVEEANPGWRLVSWAMAIETVGLTLLFLRFALCDAGANSLPLSTFIFPLCYFFVAVPWPSLLEGPLIQGLTRLDTSATTELLDWMGVPAMPHGNVIEVATGLVGIDEACSGIRSFQATVMISLFLGEFYGLSVARRIVLCFVGFALSFLFNLARMTLLVWVAAHKGIDAIASWHDPAGVTILVGCFFGLWGLGVWLKGGTRLPDASARQGHKTEGEVQSSPVSSRQSAVKTPASVLSPRSSAFHPPSSALHRLAIGLAIWIVLTEVSVEGWYRWHEARVPQAVQWTVAWPTNAPAFKDQPLPARARQILRYDEGHSAGWSDEDLTWQVVFLRWKPGRTAIHLAENHTPDICMTAAGYKLDSITPQAWFTADGLRLPFSVNQIESASRPFYVFYCLWDDRASVQGFQTMGLNYGRRLAPVLAGLRNPGQRSLEIALTGPATAAEAEAALGEELKKLIVSKP